LSFYTKHTLNKQFNALIEKAKADGKSIENVWCALETSGSMSWTQHTHTDETPLDICMSLGIFFSTLNEGAFHKNVIMFDDNSEVLQLHGSFTDMYQQITSRKDAMGSTNYQSVIDEIIRIRKENPTLPLEDYPSTLVVVSDMQFNISGRLAWYNVNEEFNAVEWETNYETTKRKLSEAFPQEWVDNFKIVWWHVNGATKDFPSNMDCGGAYNISGFDGSVITMLLGGEEKVDPETGKRVMPTQEELIDKALHHQLVIVDRPIVCGNTNQSVVVV
jgi:hypothetical protein